MADAKPIDSAGAFGIPKWIMRKGTRYASVYYLFLVLSFLSNLIFLYCIVNCVFCTVVFTGEVCFIFIYLF